MSISCAAHLAVAVAIGGFATVAQGAEASNWTACAGIADNQRRLACFDEVAAAAAKASKLNQSVPIVQWSNSGMMTTRPFHVDGPWELQWNSKGFIFQVMAYHKGQSTSSGLPKILANQTNGGSGSAYVADGGDFYLVMNAMGEWSARVVSVVE